MTFNADGTWSITNEDNENESGTYSASNGKLVIKADSETNTASYEFKNSQLIITAEDNDDGWREIEVGYYNKGAYVSTPKQK